MGKTYFGILFQSCSNLHQSLLSEAIGQAKWWGHGAIIEASLFFYFYRIIFLMSLRYLKPVGEPGRTITKNPWEWTFSYKVSTISFLSSGDFSSSITNEQFTIS